VTPRERVEHGFGSWGRWVFRFRWWTIAGMIGLSLGMASRLPHVEVDTSIENWLREGDAVKAAYDELRERFGRDQLVVLAIEPPEVFDAEFLAKLARMHAELEESVPHLEEVTSLVNVRSTYGNDDELIVEDLLEEMPRSVGELAALRERVMSTPSYIDGVISADGRITRMIVETDAYSSIGLDDDVLAGFEEVATPEPVPRRFLTGAENAEIVEAVKAVVEKYEAPDFPIQVAGSVLLPHELQAAMFRDFPRFFGTALLVIAGLLMLLFRRILPVALCLVVVVLAVVSTLGAAQLAGIALTLSTQILPSFLLSVGIGYSVHLIAIFLPQLDEHGDRREALVQALRHSGLPILMTGLTTWAGMMSFLAAELAPINEFGIISSIGVAMTLLYALILLPALLVALPLRPRPRIKRLALHDRALAACGRLAAHHPWKVTIATAVLGVAAVTLATQVRFSSNPLAYFPEEHAFRRAMDYMDERLGGAITLEVVVDTGHENGLHEPDVLNRMDAMRERVGVYSQQGLKVRKTTSLLDVVKETHQALNENRPEFYAIPQERQLLAQELLLFENSGSDDLERLVDSQFSIARFTIGAEWRDGFEMVELVDRATLDFHEIMGDQTQLTVTGLAAVITRTVTATAESMIRTYGLALILITPLMMLLIGSLRSGLVSMVPNLIPIAMTLGMMALTDIKLDMFTLLVGCIAISLAVDDTIHMIAGFRRYMAQTGDPVRSVELTLQTTGRALLFTSVVLTMGFLVFTLSSMGNLQTFGVLTAFAIATAFLLDITATPALLVLVTRGRTQR